MREVTEQEQATMAIKLHENVRQLIRDEIKVALSDPNFVNSLDIWALNSRVFGSALASSDFTAAVKQVLISRLQGY